MDQIKIFSPASVANVSCGFDVLGFCLDKIGDEMQVKMTDKPGIQIGEIKGQKLPKDPLKNVASIAVQSMLHDYPINNGYKIPEKLETRYTKYGSFLRKSSLDELPQLFNVLLGQMNLVGPRPIVPNELEHYQGEKREAFLSMKPGMTGLWQVSGRSDLDYPERVDFELSYKSKRSFFLDLKILFKTFLVVIKRKGAH